jgi:hypothetical protein
MQKKSASRSAFFNLRALLAVFLCAATAYFILIPIRSGLAFLHSHAPANASRRTLTFQERVSYQHLIEDVYWRHRIWPKDRRNAKPPLDSVMSQAQLEKKVTDYLRKSQALEDYWQRPITAEQLQAEMNRMARHTKQPEVLTELFEALGNDPFIIAECLARPALANRLLTSWFASDERIHGERKQRAESELQAHLPAVALAKAGPSFEQIKQLSGKYSEIAFVRSDSALKESNRDLGHSILLNRGQWDETVERLRAMFRDRTPAATGSAAKDASLAQIKTGVVSCLREDENRYYVTSVIKKNDDRLKPVIPSGGSWTLTGSLNSGRFEYTATLLSNGVVLVAGGFDSNNHVLASAELYDPASGSWTATGGLNTARADHTATLLANGMVLVAGGVDSSGDSASAELYDPMSGSWTLTDSLNTTRADHTATLLPNGMVLVAGGVDSSGVLASAELYDAATGNWTLTGELNAARDHHTATLLSNGMVLVAAGLDSSFSPSTSAELYDPATGKWTSTGDLNTARRSHTATLLPSGVVLVTGGFDLNFGPSASAELYDPSSGSWTPTGSLNNARYFHTATLLSNGTALTAGGVGSNGVLASAELYDPSSKSWNFTGSLNDARDRHTATLLINGTVLVAAGDGANDVLTTAELYSAAAPSPTPTATPTSTPRVTPRPRPTPHSRPTPP